MFSSKNTVSIFLCGVILKDLCSISTFAQYPYPGAFYPPPSPPLLPFGLSPAYPSSPYSIPFFPPCYGSTCFSVLPSTPQVIPSQKSTINPKPKIVKPFRIHPGSGPVIVPSRSESDHTPIIISTRTSRTPQQQPSLLSPFTNLIHTFLKSLAPNTCDCDNEYQ